MRPEHRAATRARGDRHLLAPPGRRHPGPTGAGQVHRPQDRCQRKAAAGRPFRPGRDGRRPGARQRAGLGHREGARCRARGVDRLGAASGRARPGAARQAAALAAAGRAARLRAGPVVQGEPGAGRQHGHACPDPTRGLRHRTRACPGVLGSAGGPRCRGRAGGAGHPGSPGAPERERGAGDFPGCQRGRRGRRANLVRGAEPGEGAGHPDAGAGSSSCWLAWRWPACRLARSSTCPRLACSSAWPSAGRDASCTAAAPAG